MRTPFNRPIVLRLAGINATRVTELEQVATTPLSPAERGFLWVLRVHPVRADAAERWLREQSAIAEASRRVIVEVDATMGREDCVLETPAGRIDAGPQTQLEALKALFRQSPQEPAPPPRRLVARVAHS